MDYTKMSTEELEKLASTYKQEEFEMIKELIKRGIRGKLPNTLEHPDMRPAEDDF